jgi:NADH:ubiquinone reductase (H+-translocating)
VGTGGDVKVKMMNVRPRVVIVGGGFGGINAARALRDAEVDLVVVDRRNHHLFQPLLYQVATAALSPADIASPIRGILRRQRNVEVVLGQVTAIATRERHLEMLDGERIPYDYLVLATGAVDQYFGHPEWARLAPGLKSIEDAVEIRRRFLLAFEAAERELDPEVRRSLLTTVVIGAGPTGVELAGAMAEMARRSFIRDFRRIDPASSRIILVEGTDRVLPAYDGGLSEWAEASLAKRGVEIRKKSLVNRIEADAVYVGDERIETRNVIWTAGVAASPLAATLGAELDRMGRVIVEPDLSVPSLPEVFVIGDLAHFEDRNGTPLPGLAPVAIQQGRAAGRNIASQLAGKPTRPFRYRDKGTMATIGRGAAIAEIGRLKLSGFIAWVAWIFVHVFFLIGFRNRIAVMLQWAWAYVTWQRGARLITGPVGPELNPPREPLGESGDRKTPERADAVQVAYQATRAPGEEFERVRKGR